MSSAATLSPAHAGAPPHDGLSPRARPEAAPHAGWSLNEIAWSPTELVSRDLVRAALHRFPAAGGAVQVWLFSRLCIAPVTHRRLAATRRGRRRRGAALAAGLRWRDGCETATTNHSSLAPLA